MGYSNPGVSVASWEHNPKKESVSSIMWQWSKRTLDDEIEAVAYSLDSVDLDHSWENVSRIIIPLALRYKAVLMAKNSCYTGPIICSCDDHIQAYTYCNKPYVKFWYFGELKAVRKVTI